MRILFDQGTPVPLRSELYGHEIETAYKRGWSTLENGELLAVAEADGFEGLVTTDNNLQYQQNLSERIYIGTGIIPTSSYRAFISPQTPRAYTDNCR